MRILSIQNCLHSWQLVYKTNNLDIPIVELFQNLFVLEINVKAIDAGQESFDINVHLEQS